MLRVQRLERMTKQLTQRPEDAEAGAFIGFDSSESDVSQDEVNHNYDATDCYTINIR